MSQLATIQATWAPKVLSVLRIMTALLFIEHGTMKLFGFPAPMPGMENGLPPLLLAAAVLEVFGGLILAIGLFTRPVAFILSGQMAVAYFLFHAPQGFFPVLNMGEGAILYCFIFLYFAFAGGGCWSIDAARGEKTDTSAQAA